LPGAEEKHVQLVLKGCRVSVLMTKVLEMDDSDGCTTI